MASWRVKGKTVLITGANSGVGYHTALELGRRGAKLVLLSRDERRGRDAVSGIAKETGVSAELIRCDLANPDDIRAAVDRFLVEHQALHVLVNNAGAYFPNRDLTPAGRERTLAVNHLGPFLLTRLLVEILVTSAPARVINLTSVNHRVGNVVLDDLDRVSRPWSGMGAYNDSKLMNVLFTRELARRLEGTRVTAHAVHPGFVNTGFGQDEPSFLAKIFPIGARLFASSPEAGAATTVHVACEPEVLNGAYFSRSRAGSASKRAQDDDLARRLWEVSEELLGLDGSFG